jgi:hypothetical protein
MQISLHQAIEQTIRNNNRPMTTVEIALELNNSDLYTKKDGKPLLSSTIEARVTNYIHKFSKKGTLIGLPDGPLKVGGEVVKSMVQASASENRNTLQIANPALAMKVLLNQKNYRLAGRIDEFVPDQPGFYAIRVQRYILLPKKFAEACEARKSNLLYIGVARQSLKTQLLGEEIRSEGHGPFFRNLGAMLGYLPPKGSLVNSANPKEYFFSAADEAAIIEWINQNLLINWLCMDSGFDEIEAQLLLDEQPLLNIKNNPNALKELKALRRQCIEVANS